ncbi:MAG: zinc-ribbon domain-containing protein [Halanaeroarchaeum sp.]
MGQGDTLVNATIGAIVSTVLYFVPVVSLVAPIGGGLVAGYMQKQGVGGGLKAGGTKGFVMVLPAIAIGVFAADMLAGIPIIGGLLTGSLAILVIIIVAHSLFLGMTGGLIGGAIAGSPDPSRTQQSQTQGRSEREPSSGANAAGAGTGTSRATGGGSNQSHDAGAGSPRSQPVGGGSRASNQCPNCGSANPEGASFCRECGSDLSGGGPEGGRSSGGGGANGQTCPNCGASVASDMAFCRECGTELNGGRSGGETAAGRSQSGSSRPADANAGSERTGADRSAEGTSHSADDGSDATGTHPMADAAESLLDRNRAQSEAATDLLETLADPSIDESRASRTLESAVERVDEAASVREALDDSKFDTERQVKSARREVQRADGSLAAKITPVLDELLARMDDLSDAESERSQQRTALETLTAEAERNGAVEFRSGNLGEKASTLATAVQDGEVTVYESTPSLARVVDDVTRRVDPSTSASKDLLAALKDPESTDAASVVRSTVTKLDEHDELASVVTDIDARDVRMRLNSLDEELKDRSGNVYDHLADRVRELESMLDDPDGVHDVQLYAMYQESTFYDRTLLPRLARSGGTRSPQGVSDLLEEVDRQLDHVREDYVAVRADHNHSIPKHFISLAETLQADADRQASSHPDRAAGMLVATEALLDHVEDLYERNEYSVMLRRLRG